MNEANPTLPEITGKSETYQSEDDPNRSQNGRGEYTRIEQFSGKRRWGALILALLIGIFSLIPPLLVMLDRWFSFRPVRSFTVGNWCQVKVLCYAGFQDYFFWIFNCLAIVAVLILVFARPYIGRIETLNLSPSEPGQPAMISADQYSLRRNLIIIASVGLILDVGICILFSRLPGFEICISAAVFLIAFLLGEKEFDASVVRGWLETLKEKAPLYGTIIFSEIALVLFIRDQLSFRRSNWIFAVLLLIAIGAVYWQRKKLNKIYWVFTLALVLLLLNQNSWKFSKIGDEYDFFDQPTFILARQSIFEVWESFFNALNVHSRYAYISSLVQFIPMRFFGFNHFGWHFSSVFLMALSVPLLYNFLKSYVAERTAFIAAVLLATSQYLINFSKIGYNNLQALFVMILMLWTATWAIKTQKSSAFFLLGISIAGCFYSFPAVLYLLPLPLILLLLFSPPKSWAIVRRYLYALVGLLLFVIPLAFQPAFWSEMLKGTAFSNEVAQSEISLFDHLASNFLYSIFSFLFVADEGHFIVSSFSDPLSAAFIPIGILLVIASLHRSRFMVFLAFSYLIEIILVGTTSNYIFTPKTRMFLILPFFFIFAALGIDWLIGLFAGVTSQPGKFITPAITAILVVIGILNLAQATVILRDRFGELHEFELVFLRMLQHDAPEGTYNFKNFLLFSEAERGWGWNVKFQEVYGLPDSKAQLLQAVVEGDNIPENWDARLQERNLVVIIPPWLPDPAKSSLSAKLQEQGKIPCDVRYSPKTEVLFQMWTSEDYQDLCIKALSQ